MNPVTYVNVFRLLPGGAVLCMSQFSKSIKVMQLLDQQMNTKGKKMTEEADKKKKMRIIKEAGAAKKTAEHSALQR